MQSDDAKTRPMKLAEALQVLKTNELKQDAEPFPVFLTCGFTPLHLQTFLAAHLQEAFPARRVTVEVGIFGDLTGNLEMARRQPYESVCLVMEWQDLDARLGIRNLGSWSPDSLPDIVEGARNRLEHLSALVRNAGEDASVVICLPTLPLPPVSYMPGWRAGLFEARLREAVYTFASQAGELSGVRLVNPQRLDSLSPVDKRLDVESELHFGFPYRVSHASYLADLMVRLIGPCFPKKGLITDVDDTLWRGILGEVGVDGISWDLDHGTHIHGLYQRFLQSLSEAGVLIGIASKNDPKNVELALARADIILKTGSIFPAEIHWGAKSESVGRILKAWNISADSVVFVDDSRTEIAEVKMVHPDIEGVLFPEGEEAAYAMIQRLRDLFGKERVSSEDAIRRDSLRVGSVFHEEMESDGEAANSFLKQAEAELTVSYAKEPLDTRALELVNKTNQFNLNGKRYTEKDWQLHLAGDDTILMIVSYEDKYGPLGKIVVLSGCRQDDCIRLNTWVMSCRAFSRRIEYQCLQLLFGRLDVDEIVFDFHATGRNTVMQRFFKDLSVTTKKNPLRLSKKLFFDRCPKLFHKTTEV